MANRHQFSVARKRASLACMIFPAACMAILPYVLNDWQDSKALREQLGTLVAESEAIVKIAQEEKRDLTAEEEKRIDAILGSGTQGEDGFKAGLVHATEAKIKRIENVEKVRDQIAGSIGRPGSDAGRQLAQQETPDATAGDGIIARVRVPASVSRPQLRAHKVHASREENQRAAYALGQFALARIANHGPAQNWCTEHGVITNLDGMSGGTPADGGYLVPSELDSAITYVRDMHGVFRKEAKRVPMTSDTKDHAVKTSGLPYSFVAEGVAPGSLGKQVYANVSLVAKKVTTIAKWTSEVGEDAIIAIGDDLAMDLGEAFALAEDDCGFIADASAAYGSHSGITNAMVGLLGDYLLPAGMTTLEAITNAEFRKIISMVPGKYRKGCKWYCNSTVYDAALAPILDAAGGNTQGDLEGGPGRLRFKGYDVVETQVLPDAVDVVAGLRFLIFGNLQAGAVFGTRREIRISRSEHVYWTTDEEAIKGTQRFNTKIHAVGTAGATGAFLVVRLPVA